MAHPPADSIAPNSPREAATTTSVAHTVAEVEQHQNATATLVNVAEGHKQRVILESEGLLQAKSNEADAQYKTVFREAEARLQQSLMEASALAEQVDKVAASLAKDKSNVTQDDRERALAALIELRRLEQLKAIATSQSNSTYFFGDKSALGIANDSFNVDYAQTMKAAIQTKPQVNADAGLAVLE